MTVEGGGGPWLLSPRAHRQESRELTHLDSLELVCVASITAPFLPTPSGRSKLRVYSSENRPAASSRRGSSGRGISLGAAGPDFVRGGDIAGCFPLALGLLVWCASSSRLRSSDDARDAIRFVSSSELRWIPPHGPARCAISTAHHALPPCLKGSSLLTKGFV